MKKNYIIVAICFLFAGVLNAQENEKTIDEVEVYLKAKLTKVKRRI